MGFVNFAQGCVRDRAIVQCRMTSNAWVFESAEGASGTTTKDVKSADDHDR